MTQQAKRGHAARPEASVVVSTCDARRSQNARFCGTEDRLAISAGPQLPSRGPDTSAIQQRFRGVGARASGKTAQLALTGPVLA
jgi:hypothetical protein